MMLQFDHQQNIQDSHAIEKQHREDEDEDEDEEEQKKLAREQIKRMMNKMQEMQQKHEQQSATTTLVSGKSCGAINGANRWLHMSHQLRPSTTTIDRISPRHDPQEDTQTTTATNESHELIKRRFFEKLERRKSIGNSTASSQMPNPSSSLLMMRNFTSKLSNLREENEYAYGFCSPPAAGCEIVVSAIDEHQNNTSSTHSSADASGGQRADYMNSELFVCDSRSISPRLTSSSSKDITTFSGSVKNDNALTVSPMQDEEGEVDEKEEAVYLTLEDWRAKNAMHSNSNNNKEQSSGDLLLLPLPTGQQSASQMMAPIEQKQIKPLDCENNKPQSQSVTSFNNAADMHSDYKHPIPVGQQQQQQQQVSITDRTQVPGERRANERGADLVILPKKSVNSQQRLAKLPTQAVSMRKNASTTTTMLVRRSQKDAGRCARRTSSRRRTCEQRSCSSSSSSSDSSICSSSSSAIDSSPSSSCSSSSLDERLPVVLRLEQLSLSEDDLKSLISHSESCRCGDCSRRQARKLASGRCFSPSSSSSPFDRVDSAVKLDKNQQQKDTDSSNSSSGNSSATRSLMNSLFRRSNGSSGSQRTKIGGQATRSSRSKPSLDSKSQAATAKSVPNLIVNSHSSAAAAAAHSRADSSQGRYWSLFAGGGGGSSSIGPSHASIGSTRRRKQTSDGRDSASNQIYSQQQPQQHWQPKTAGYRLHLPVADSELTYAAPPNKQYHQQQQQHSCSRKHHHQHHPHGSSRHHRHHHRGHHHHHHHHHQARRTSQTSRRAHLSATENRNSEGQQREDAHQQEEEVGQVWGQLIEINKLDGSQVVELERQPGKSWGFFVARGAIQKTRGIFISRIQQQPATGGEKRVGVPSGLLGVGDRLLALDEHQIADQPDYDISRVNRLISKKNKILLKVKPFKG